MWFEHHPTITLHLPIQKKKKKKNKQKGKRLLSLKYKDVVYTYKSP